MKVEDLVYVIATEDPERGSAFYGPLFTGNYYTWHCPVCNAWPGCKYPYHHTAVDSARRHLRKCPGEPLTPHKHVTDSIHYPPHGTCDPATAIDCYVIH